MKMGKVSDYISSLDSKDNIDPLVVASTLLELHNEEMDTVTNKVAKLETDLEAVNATVAEKDLGIRDLKARNWDLVNRVDTSKSETPKKSEEDSELDVEDANFDDFFEKED